MNGLSTDLKNLNQYMLDEIISNLATNYETHNKLSEHLKELNESGLQMFNSIFDGFYFFIYSIEQINYRKVGTCKNSIIS